MPVTNYTAKEVQFKVVLYGPAFSGKSTTFNYIHGHLDAEFKDDIASLKSASDQTLLFEYVPRDATLLDDFRIRIELFTVPGAVHFNAPRKLVLRDVDGIIFVADSEWSKIHDNAKTFENMEANLKKLSVDPNEIPIVLQYNKRDLPEVAPVHYLDFVLNNRPVRRPAFETAAINGTNIFESLEAVLHGVIQRFLESTPASMAGSQPGITAEG